MLRILYWNVRKTKGSMRLALEDREEYDAVALQEVWMNTDPGKEGETYCPRAGDITLCTRAAREPPCTFIKGFRSQSG